VAGAREGALMGIPSIAVSLAAFVNPDYTYAAQCGARFIKQVAQRGMPKGTFLNVNVPNKRVSQIKGIKLTRQGLIPIHGRFRRRTDPNFREYHWMTGKIPVRKKDNRFDTYALNNNYVTVTPIQSDQTDYTFLEQLQHWKI
jgi:5'-nucleotidase